MLGDRLSFSAVIPTLDEYNTIRSVLDSLLATSWPDDRLEVIVVDGGSTDGTVEVVAEYAAEHDIIRLVELPGANIPESFNYAMELATGDILFHTNGHTTVDSEVFTHFAEGFQERAPSAGVIGPRQVPVSSDTYRGTAIEGALGSLLGATSKRYEDAEGEVDTINHGAYRLDVLSELGGMRTDLERAEDYELNRRIAEAGYVVYQYPAAKVYYRPRETFTGLWRQSRANARWKLRVLSEQGRLPTIVEWVPSTVTTLALGVMILSLPLGIVSYATVTTLYTLLLAVAGVMTVQRNDSVTLAHLPGVFVALVTIHASWVCGGFDAVNIVE
jgi:cellulose synthase/poly-beta-1,6-N-acetylglucosamine synthase-like glycosyltransferase